MHVHTTGVDPATADVSSRILSLTGEALTALLEQQEKAFDDKFEKVRRTYHG